MRRRRAGAPRWFQIACVLVYVWLVHVVGLHDLEAGPVALSFFGFLILVGELVWTALQAVGHATLVALSWTVNALWLIAKELRNGLSAFGKDTLKAFRKSWKFLRSINRDTLKAGWTKFWHLVDRVREGLEHLFKPVFDFLRHLRDELLAFYTKWVRPVLDTIGVAQKTLRVLEALHIEWAKKLDAKLSQIADDIDRPFRIAMEKVNEAINLVNRVVTLDGALQRLVLVKTLARDWKVVGDEYAKWHKPPLTEEELKKRSLQEATTLPAWEPGQELGKYLSGEGGKYDGIIQELIPDWRLAAGVTRPSQ